ncbi:SdpI family protein [Rhodococcus sp. TAF43]|uniref:SdpI family protein n=1 Tax=Rhodococcus sp. TAF43 TaxID=3237483 RepID=UPI003F99A4BA
MDTSELLGLTISMTSSTLIAAGFAGLMPHLIGDEPNPVMGIRTKATMASHEAWQLAHQVAQPILRRTVWTAVAGLCIQVVIGFVTGFGSLPSAVAATVVCAAAFIVLIAAALKGNAAAKTLSR